jgi:hypothetical protein
MVIALFDSRGMSFFEALQSWWTWIFLMEAIEDIAWSVMITSDYILYLTKNNGIDKINRNISVFLVLTIVVNLSPHMFDNFQILYSDKIYHLLHQIILIFLGWWDFYENFHYPFIHFNSPLFLCWQIRLQV